ncbi:MAG: hypothetical protein WC455_13945 [Dehalococcoidia bacterium]|jgi:hypothetical protein
MDLYRVQSQDTYHGKTGGGLVAMAKVAQSKAGTWEIWIDGEIAELSDYDELILTDTTGIVAAVTLSPTALRKMQGLVAQCERAYKGDISSAASAMGLKGGLAKSERKAEANRAKAALPPKPGKKPRGRPKAMMTKVEKKAKLDAMKAQMAEYDRTGDVVLRDQMARSIEEAEASWIAK